VIGCGEPVQRLVAPAGEPPQPAAARSV
jgi:hypothetical protein